MHSLTSSDQPVSSLWLPEPTEQTLCQLRDGAVRIVEAVARELSAVLRIDNTDWTWPSAEWDLSRRDEGWRIELAGQFEGFDPAYPTPPPSEIRLHRDSAVRANLAQQLQARAQDDR
jgi:hypothetical protein